MIGGFRTQLSPPPFFIEERLTWEARRLPLAGRRGLSLVSCSPTGR
jgi:hypothetical protein